MGLYLGHDKVANGGFIGDYDSLPVGSILPYSSENLPTGYLLCDGSEVSRSSYEELFKVVGTSFGEGNGTSTFNLPNLKGRVPVGTDGAQDEFSMLGKLGGSKYLQEHNHGMIWASSTGSHYAAAMASNRADTTSYITNDTIKSAGTGDGGNLQPYIVVNYIIKASGTAVLTGNVVDSLEENSTTNAPSQRAVNDGIRVLGKVSKNLFNSSVESGGYDTTTGAKVNASNLARNSVPIKVEPGTQYIFSNENVAIGMNVLEYDASLKFIQCKLYNGGTPFTTTSTTQYINCFRSPTAFDKPQLEKGLTITSYEEYCEPAVAVKDSNGVYHEVNFYRNIVTDGPAVKTGRIIDGKFEYVKRYHIVINSTNGDVTKSLGFDLSKVTVTNIDGAFISNSDNIFAINSGVQSTIAYDYAVQCRATDNMLLVRTYNGNFKSADINIYYINK